MSRIMSLKQKIKLVINGIIKRGYWFDNIAFQDCRKFYRYNTFNTKVVNLGSTSAVAAFNYEGLEIQSANWAMSRNPLSGDLAILKNYCSFLAPRDSCVLIPLCPFSALAGGYKYLDDRYYPILYPTMIPNYSYIHDVQVRRRWNEPMWTYPIYAPFLDLYKFVFKNKEKKMSEKGMEEDAAIKINSWCSEFSLKDLSSTFSLVNMDAISDAVDTLNQIISFCIEHNSKPVIVVPPVYDSLAKFFTPEVKNRLIYLLVDSIDDRSVKILDYLVNEEFSKNKSLFKDSFLLNRKGSKMFTRRILKDLCII